MGEIYGTFRRIVRSVTHHREDDIYTALVDLDGDGSDEMFVVFLATYHCGNRGECPAGLYRRLAGAWKLIGTPDLPINRRAGIPFVFVEDATHNGWRIFNTGDYRYCWNPAADLTFRWRADPFDVVRWLDGEPGYDDLVAAGTPCPSGDSGSAAQDGATR